MKMWFRVSCVIKWSDIGSQYTDFLKLITFYSLVNTVLLLWSLESYFVSHIIVNTKLTIDGY